MAQDQRAVAVLVCGARCGNGVTNLSRAAGLALPLGLPVGRGATATDRQAAEGDHYRWIIGLPLFAQWRPTCIVPLSSPAACDGVVETAFHRVRPNRRTET